MAAPGSAIQNCTPVVYHRHNACLETCQPLLGMKWHFFKQSGEVMVSAAPVTSPAQMRGWDTIVIPNVFHLGPSRVTHYEKGEKQ